MGNKLTIQNIILFEEDFSLLAKTAEKNGVSLTELIRGGINYIASACCPESGSGNIDFFVKLGKNPMDKDNLEEYVKFIIDLEPNDPKIEWDRLYRRLNPPPVLDLQDDYAIFDKWYLNWQEYRNLIKQKAYIEAAFLFFQSFQEKGWRMKMNTANYDNLYIEDKDKATTYMAYNVNMDGVLNVKSKNIAVGVLSVVLLCHLQEIQSSTKKGPPTNDPSNQSNQTNHHL